MTYSAGVEDGKQKSFRGAVNNKNRALLCSAMPGLTSYHKWGAGFNDLFILNTVRNLFSLSSINTLASLV